MGWLVGLQPAELFSRPYKLPQPASTPMSGGDSPTKLQLLFACSSCSEFSRNDLTRWSRKQATDNVSQI